MEELKHVLARIFREYRKRSGYSQWKLSIIAKIDPRSIQIIERGELQPGVMLIVRLVCAMGSNVGFFFADLAKEAGLIRREDRAPSMARSRREEEDVEGVQVPIRTIFSGKSVSPIRSRNRQSVKRQAIRSDNILNTEKGRQEPAVMTALSMVATTGVDIGIFFNRLAYIQNKFEKDKYKQENE